jgi:hypothetical protein
MDWMERGGEQENTIENDRDPRFWFVVEETMTLSLRDSTKTRTLM